MNAGKSWRWASVGTRATEAEAVADTTLLEHAGLCPDMLDETHLWLPNRVEARVGSRSRPQRALREGGRYRPLLLGLRARNHRR
jgi:hypothetical protein